MENNKVLEIINNIKNKNNKVIIFIPEVDEPNASVYELFFHAHVLKKNGYNTKILIFGDSTEKPYWIEDKILDVDIELADKVKLSVSAEDIVIIPEILTSVFEQTKNIPSIRVAFVQSVDYMMNGLMIGTNLSDFNIKNIITTSKKMSDFIYNITNTKYNFKHYNIGIPDYFKNEVVNKKPIIPIIYRNKNEITKIIKLFYLKYPQYRWIMFDGMVYENDTTKQLSREDFAKRLDESYAAVWIDRISSFGTFPLECMKTNTLIIGLLPDFDPSYLNDEFQNVGMWTNNIYEIPDLIAKSINMYLEDSPILDEIVSDYNKITKQFSQENSEMEILKIYDELLNDRMESLNEYLKNKKNEE